MLLEGTLGMCLHVNIEILYHILCGHPAQKSGNLFYASAIAARRSKIDPGLALECFSEERRSAGIQCRPRNIAI
jgi:hypothetical protein